MTNFYSIKTKLLYEFLLLEGTSCPLADHELQAPSDQSEECLLTRSQCRLLMLGGAVRACPIVAVVRRRRLGFNNQQSHAVLTIASVAVTDSGADGGKQPESLLHRGLGGRRSHFCEGHPGEWEPGRLSACQYMEVWCTVRCWVSLWPAGCPVITPQIWFEGWTSKYWPPPQPSPSLMSGLKIYTRVSYSRLTSHNTLQKCVAKPLPR